MKIPVANKSEAIYKVISAFIFVSFFVGLILYASYKYFEHWIYYLIAYLVLAISIALNYLRKQWIIEARIVKEKLIVSYRRHTVTVPLSDLKDIRSGLNREISLSGKFSKTYLIRFKRFYLFGNTLYTYQAEEDDLIDFLDSKPIYIQVLEKEIEHYQSHR